MAAGGWFHLARRVKSDPSDRYGQFNLVANIPIAAEDWKKVSVRHRKTFEQLSKVWRFELSRITTINNNVECFREKFLIDSGSYGTEVYVCLGSNGIESAIKRFPKVICNLLRNERDLLTYNINRTLRLYLYLYQP